MNGYRENEVLSDTFTFLDLLKKKRKNVLGFRDHSINSVLVTGQLHVITV